MRYEFVINGRPASKKNSRRNFGRVSLPSEAYIKFESNALSQLLPMGLKTMTEPLGIIAHFKTKGKYRQDLDNALSSIFDVLTKAKVIQDDDLIKEAHVTTECGYDEFSTEIVLTDDLAVFKKGDRVVVIE